MRALRTMAALLAAGTVYVVLSAAAGAQDTDDSPPLPITVTEVAADELAPRVPAAGTVFSRNEGQITAGIAARIAWIAEPGDVVSKGDPVVRFDCQMLRLRREEQLAQVERERINYQLLGREAERWEQLGDEVATSAAQLARIQGDRDLAQSALRIARVRVRQTEAELERCVIGAPFDGVITGQRQRAGEDVERSTVLATMTDTRTLEVRASVPVRFLPRVATGALAVVRLDGLEVEGNVRTIVPAADSQSQQFEVRIDLPAGASAVLAAGQLVGVTLPLTSTHALTVPRDSIVLREDGAYVMRITDDDRAESVAIEFADASGDHVAVRGALTAGDRVAVRGAEALSDGALVLVQAGS